MNVEKTRQMVITYQPQEILSRLKISDSKQMITNELVQETGHENEL